jgi:tetratricopeptide (TPR) repeat protein
MIVTALVVALTAVPAQLAQPPAPPTAPLPAARERAAAFYEFMRGRLLEGEGEIDAAIEAYRRALRADPGSAEIHAELAGLYARQNRGDEAVAEAKQAIAIDPENGEAHWVLGTIYAARSQGEDDTAFADAVESAIVHIEKARPSRPYDLGLSLTLGRLYLTKKDFPKAIERLKWLADQEPGAAEVGFLLSQAYAASGKRDEAIAELRRVVDVEPRYFRAWVTLADLLERNGRFDEAAEAYGQAVAQNSRSTELRTRHASVLAKAGQTAAARKVLRQLAVDAPTEGDVLYLLSDVERQSGEYDEAESAARRLIALEPKGIRGAYALAQVYEARREHRKVIETLEPAVRTADAGGSGSRPLAPLHLRIGMAYQELGEFDAAIQAFERAKAAGGGDVLFDAYLAQGLTGAGRTAQALDVVSQLRKAHPEDFRFARLEADALAKRGDKDGAVAVLEGAIERAEAQPEAYVALAGLCVEIDRLECASATLDRAEAKFPDHLLVAFQRGALLEKQKQYDEAEQAFRKALARDPQHGPTLNYLGYMLADRGVRLDEAVALLERALETDRWNGSYLDSLGWAHFKRGDYEKADKYLTLAVERLPRNSVVLEHLGDLRWKQGNRVAAIEAWERALAGDRDSINPDTIAQKVEEARRARP